MIRPEVMSKMVLGFLLLIILVCSICALIDRIKPLSIPMKFRRNNNYRSDYFKSNKGLFGKGIYFCPFCGKMMTNKENIQIDHINSVHRVQNSRFLRKKFQKIPDGVNNINNLVHSCPRCNRVKGSKGGLWVFWGHFGQYFMPFIRYVTLGTIMYKIGSTVLFGGWTL